MLIESSDIRKEAILDALRKLPDSVNGETLPEDIEPTCVLCSEPITELEDVYVKYGRTVHEECGAQYENLEKSEADRDV